MTPESPEELEGLNSSSPSSRAKAVGWLIQHPRAITTRALMNALQDETVPQVRRLLLRVQETRQRALDAVDEEPKASSKALGSLTLADQASVSDYVDIAALVRHELSPAVGWIRLAADSEIESFGSSKTNDAVRKLQRRIDGLVTIIKSSEGLNIRRISLPDILMEAWPDTGSVFQFTPTGEDRAIDIETDESLFSMLLSNVFQNAIDASVEATGTPAAHVTWGSTDRNFWVRVDNQFSGDRFSLADVVRVGNSSKMAHQGQGLLLIKTIAERLGFAISLEGFSGTASFSLSGARPND